MIKTVFYHNKDSGNMAFASIKSYTMYINLAYMQSPEMAIDIMIHETLHIVTGCVSEPIVWAMTMLDESVAFWKKLIKLSEKNSRIFI